MAVKQKTSEGIDYESWSLYFVFVFHLFCNKYEVFHYLSVLYYLSSLCYNFCHGWAIIFYFSSIGPKSSKKCF